MQIPYYYTIRNFWSRRLTTALTAIGMGLVVYVFAATQMLAEGLEKTLVETGSADNAIVIRRSSGSEVQSGIERHQASIIESVPGIATGIDGNRLVAKELVVLINLQKRENLKPAQVVIRGIGPASFQIRPQVRMIEGRSPRPGSSEIMTGASIARRFRGCSVGETLRFAMRTWTVVGVFDAGTTGFNSEIWGDAEQLMAAFRRPVFSSVLFRMADPRDFTAIRSTIESDPRLTVEVKPEVRYYRDQSEAMATFLRILGVTLTIIFSLGAIIGAMITMYASVANRTAEIGTMRALGFARRSILASFILEAIFLGLLGGCAGLAAASAMQLVTISTLNWQTFSELAFSFVLTPAIALQSLVFAMVMGVAGGLLPALRASRIPIVDALRAQ